MKPDLDRSRLQSVLLDNFPHPLMLTGKDRKIIDANPAACELGAEIGEFCWGSFGQCHFIPDADRDYFAEHKEAPPEGTHCSFCKAEACLDTQTPQNNPAVEAFGRIFDTYWTPLDEDRFLHYAIDVTEQRQAEDALIESDARFHALFDGMSNGVAVYNAVDDGADFVFVDINQAGQKMDNMPREKAVGRKVTEVFPGVEEFGFLDVLRRVWRTGDPEEHPISEYKDDLVSYWRKNSIYKLPSGEVVAIYSDETATKQAEATIHAENARFAAVMDSLDAVVYAADMQTHEVIFANKRAKKDHGEQLVGKKCWQVLQAGQTEPCAFCTNDQLLDANGNPSGPYLWETKNAHDERWYQRRDEAIRWPDGRIVRLEIAFDITERKQAEAISKRSADIVQRSSTVAFLWRNAENWPVEYVSENAIQLFGYTAEDFISGRIAYSAVIHPDDFPRVGEEVAKHSSDPACLHFEHKQYRIITKDGAIRWVEDQTNVRRDENNQLTHYEGLVIDITERKRTEEKVRDSLKEKEVLLREIHHRVKNNLQVIVSLLRMHARRSDNEQVQKVFGDCRNRVNAMSLIHEALYRSEDLARIDTEPYLEKLCRHLRQAHGLASDKGIVLTVGKDDLPLGMDQGVAVGMIVCELVSNIFKHAFPEGEPGSVLVGLSSVGEDDVELIVQDDGVGLPPDVDISNAPSLGLHLVSITATHELGGTIEVERDGGTRFIIRFKRKDI